MDRTIHQMKLQPVPFVSIKNGRKIIESRLFDEKRKLIKIEDVIEFKKEPDLSEFVKAQVVALLHYPTFEAMFSDFPSEWFGLPDPSDLISQIETFYSKEDQIKYGVLGIKIQLL